MDKNAPKKYSLPLYEDGVKTEYTIDFEEGDDKWRQFMELYSEIPIMVNVRTKRKNG